VINAAPGTQYRFNWNTPFILSPHNPSIVWLGGNRVFKSFNRGDTWVAGPDLTKQIDRNTVALMGVAGNQTMLSKHDGVTSYSTIVSLAESPVVPGVVWAGTDDGNLQVSTDGGASFSEVGKDLPGLPANHQHWISRIDASHFDAATAYVAVDGHRSDDLKPYVFVTRDYGKTWKSISSNLPPYGNVQVVREDPRNKDLLYVGTEFGLYLSTNGGTEWQRFMNNLPTVRVDDILVHPRDGDLIVATHGRSVWIADDITPLQQLTPSLLAQDAALLDIRPAVAWLNDQQAGSRTGGQKVYIGENPPRGTALGYYLKTPASGEVTLTVTDFNGRVIRNLEGSKAAGLNRVMWDLSPNPPPRTAGGGAGGGGGGFGGFGAPQAVEPGTYLVTLTVDGRTYSKPVSVLQDIWLGVR
jgi:hypothetical protein